MSAKRPEELIERHEAFLACAPVDRPLVGFWLGGYFPTQQFPRGSSAWGEDQPLRPDDVHLGPFAADYENLYRLHRDADDDFFYVGSAYWGLPWLEAILGCPIVAGRTSCWAQPCLGSLADVPDSPGDLDANPWWQRLLAFTQGLIELSAGRFPVCPPLLRGPGDAANAMRGAMDFILEYVDEPALTSRLLNHCAAVRQEVVRRLNAIIPAWHGTHAAGGYPSKVWSRQSVAYNQDDAAALLSPDLFADFLLPLERRMAQDAAVNFIHLHSSCLYPVEPLLADASYQVLEINIDHAGVAPALREVIPTLQRIQAARRPLLLWGHFTQDDYALLKEHLSPAGLSLQPIVEPHEAPPAWGA